MLYLVLSNARHWKSWEIMKIKENHGNQWKSWKLWFPVSRACKTLYKRNEIYYFPIDRKSLKILKLKENLGKSWFPCFWGMQKPIIILAIFDAFQCPALKITENHGNQRKSRKLLEIMGIIISCLSGVPNVL